MTALDTLIPAQHRQLLIGEDWRPGGGGEAFPVVDPANGEIFTEVAGASVGDGIAAVAAAAEALPAWAATPPRQRGEILRRAFQLMTERAEGISELMVREMGKALPEARAETAYAAEFFRWYGEEAVRGRGEVMTAPAGTNRIMVINQPIGVSVLVTPWNFPAAMATRKLGPALAAGCTTVLKPASDTPLTALAIAALLRDAGVPPGVVNVVPSRKSSELVKAMLAQEPVRKLSFTGSTEVGRILLAQAAERVIDCSMELGGNAPFVVFADADLDAAVAGAMIAKLRNGGESCTAANRFYIEAPVVEEFTARFADAVGEVRMGSGLEPDVQLGPMITATARDEIAGLVEAAAGTGAKVRAGGRIPDRAGYFYPPTILSEVALDADILDHEIFGPVAPIVAFEDTDQMLAAANHTEMGLVSYVYSRDLAKALRVAEGFEAGMVGINRGLISDPAAPFGGVKQSGMGREGGHEGMTEFQESKYIAVNW